MIHVASPLCPSSCVRVNSLTHQLASGFAPHSKLVLKDVMQKLGDAKISESAVSCMNEVCTCGAKPSC